MCLLAAQRDAGELWGSPPTSCREGASPVNSEQNGQSSKQPEEQRPEPLSPDAAQVRFQIKLERVLAENQVRIVYLGITSAVVVAGKPINHLLHVWLTLGTLGLWGIVYLILALRGGERWWAITGDNTGELYFARVPRRTPVKVWLRNVGYSG